ncbi:MAG: YgiT-type zinc finger protein [Planctomycetes bacterium]|nr:YgiT-type zinc finger protein [Planctomycetota bacterium]
MGRTYSDCHFCGGEVKEQRITREVWRHGSLHLIENVPVGVCQQCSQKTILPQVAKAIDRVIAGETPPDHLIQVPAYRLPEPETTTRANRPLSPTTRSPAPGACE